MPVTISEKAASVNAGTPYFMTLPVTSGALGEGQLYHLLGLQSDLFSATGIGPCTLGEIDIAGYSATLTAEESTESELYAALNANSPSPVILPVSASGIGDLAKYHFLNLRVEPLSGETISCTLGTIGVAAYAAEIHESTPIACTLGTVTVASLKASIEQNTDTNIDCTLGTVTVAAYAAGITAGTKISCTLGTIAVASYAATIQADVDTGIDCTAGAVAVAAHKAIILAVTDTTVLCTAGAVAVTPLAATINKPQLLSVAVGAVVVASYKATISSGTSNWVGVVATDVYTPGDTEWEVFRPGAEEFEVAQ